MPPRRMSGKTAPAKAPVKRTPGNVYRPDPSGPRYRKPPAARGTNPLKGIGDAAVTLQRTLRFQKGGLIDWGVGGIGPKKKSR